MLADCKVQSIFWQLSDDTKHASVILSIEISHLKLRCKHDRFKGAVTNAKRANYSFVPKDNGSTEDFQDTSN